jgi:hypothetical protein
MSQVSPATTAYPQEPDCTSIPDQIADAMALMRGPQIAFVIRSVRHARQAGISTAVINALFAAFPKRHLFITALHNEATRALRDKPFIDLTLTLAGTPRKKLGRPPKVRPTISLPARSTTQPDAGTPVPGGSAASNASTGSMALFAAGADKSALNLTSGAV